MGHLLIPKLGIIIPLPALFRPGLELASLKQNKFDSFCNNSRFIFKKGLIDTIKTKNIPF